MTTDRQMIAKLAAHESWAKTADRQARTLPARAAADARFEREVDPEGVLPLAERRLRAESARKAHYTRMARMSALARRAKTAGAAPVEGAAPASEDEALP